MTARPWGQDDMESKDCCASPPTSFAFACDCFPLGQGTPTQHDSKVERHGGTTE